MNTQNPQTAELLWSPCACGGRYRLGYVGAEPVLEHSLPTCAEYDAAEDTRAAVQFSQRQRERNAS